MIVLGYLSAHHKNCQIYSGKTNRPGERCCDSLSQMALVRSLTFLFRSLAVTHSLARLDLYISSSDTNICSAMAFLSLENSDHVVSVCIDFPSNSEGDVLFHDVAYDYSRADWDGLSDHLRDVPRGDIFKLGATADSEFHKYDKVGIDVYIPHMKYQVKPHSSPWFSGACAAAIAHRNHFFRSYEQNKSCESKLKLIQAVLIKSL